MRLKTLWILAKTAAIVAACASSPEMRPPGVSESARGDRFQDELARITPTRLLPTPDAQRQIDALIDGYFARAGTRRAYIMVDKPLYQPGETIWYRADLRQTSTFLPVSPGVVTMQLLSPKGSIVAQHQIPLQEGVAANAFDLPPDVEGGEYLLQIVGYEGTVDKRPVIVSTYEAPRLKKTMEFLRKAYGPGDKVAAAIEISRGTGEPFANRALTAVVVLDDAELTRVPVTTDAAGKAVIRFELPARIERGDALLTVLAEDGGVTESIQKRVPILLADVRFSMFPEGGDLVTGLPSRIYFSAENTLGKPADVEGRVVDDTGREITRFASFRDGMGRFELRPQEGRTYHVEILKPVGIAKRFEVPAPKNTGCTLQAIDDFASEREELRIGVFCTKSETLLAEAILRERRVASGAFGVVAGRPTVVALPIDPTAQGAVRVTLFDGERRPMAERLVYRGHGRDLKIEIAPDRPSYGPRDRVTLRIKTTDRDGRPVAASFGLAVVDDAVLSFADDKTANLLAHLYLEAELPAVPIEDPNFYFSGKPEAARALDLVVATKGWRRFDWTPVWNPPPPPSPPVPVPDEAEFDVPMAAPVEEAAGVRAPAPARPRPLRRAPAAPPPIAAPRAQEARPPLAGGGAKVKEVAANQAVAPGRFRDLDDARRARGRGGARARAEADKKIAMDHAQGGWAVVRVFPTPTYEPGYDGPRTDFRETIYWNPIVRTDANGVARVAFHLSDAVTTFRATAEGVSAGGLPGRGEAVIASKMPLALDARLPLEVSSGDRVDLPVTLANETDRPLDARLRAQFGQAFRLRAGAPATEQTVRLAPRERRALFFPLEVVGTRGEGEIAVSVEAAGLQDEIRKNIKVSPLGFPFEVALAGTAKGAQTHEVDLTGALPGSIVATVQMYPSPLAAMTSGTEAILREPYGCFEQTSSSNYPNVMVLRYLEEHEVASPQIVEKAQGLLDRGYKRLVGFETRQKGYEWFGQTPAHEALTAYGLMEFQDMVGIYDGVDRQMIERTAAWLLSRRDGKGGFLRDAKALDSFGRASEATTNGYIVWALTEAGRRQGMDKELDVQKRVGLESKDPYLVALAANAWLNVAPKDEATRAIVKRLAAMQDSTGAFPGAKESITMSGGESLVIETTSLALLALLKASDGGEHEPAIRRAVEWLNGKRDGYGGFGSTQGTVLALKALTAYAKHSRATQASGVASVVVNGREIGRLAFDKGRREAIVFEDVGAALRPGKNVVEVRLDGGGSMPYSVAIEYRAARPQSSPQAVVDLTTELLARQVKMGEGVRLRAVVQNKTDQGRPMTLARIGIPGGLTYQTWQLKELRDKGIIDFYETREREVILYFRALAPSAEKRIDLDLLAAIPGRWVAPASSAYLYYTDEHKAWAAPVEISVTP